MKYVGDCCMNVRLFQNTGSCIVKFESNYKSSNLNVNEEVMVVMKITLKEVDSSWNRIKLNGGYSKRYFE